MNVQVLDDAVASTIEAWSNTLKERLLDLQSQVSQQTRHSRQKDAHHITGRKNAIHPPCRAILVSDWDSSVSAMSDSSGKTTQEELA